MTMLPGLEAAVGSFPYRLRPYSNITPFTYRDGLTYLEVLEELRKWLRYDLIGHLDGEFDKLIKEYDTATEALKTEMDRYTAAIKIDRDAFEEFVDKANDALAKAMADYQAEISTDREAFTTFVDGVKSAIEESELASAESARLAEYWRAQTEGIQLDIIKNSPSGYTKLVFGGVFPKPQRVPTLSVADMWPNAKGPAVTRVLWSENKGRTLYAFGSDQMLRKTTDGGESWTNLAYLNWAPAPQNVFLKLPSGTLITVNITRNIYRSVDDGKTWAIVAPFQAGQEMLGTQSIAYDPVRRFTYLAMYGGANQTEMLLYRSADDGLTWGVIHRFPGILTDDPDKIVHLHSVQWDPYMQRIIISAGDSTPATGLYRTSDSGNSVEPLITNRMLSEAFLDAPRTIGVIPFPDYLAWASDSTANPFLFRVKRTELGKANPVVERIYRLNSTAWFSCRASDDGSRWIISASQEAVNQSIDRLTHIYAVEDQGATVYEVGTIAPVIDAPAGSLMPVGLAEQHGETLLMASRNNGGVGATWKFRLGMGGGTPVPWPARSHGDVVAYKTIGTGPSLALAGGGGTAVIGLEVTPSQATSLYLYDAQIFTLTGSIGNATIGIRRKDTGEILMSTGTKGIRMSEHAENNGAVRRSDLTNTVEVEIFVTNVHAAAITVTGSVTYGFGIKPPA